MVVEHARYVGGARQRGGERRDGIARAEQAVEVREVGRGDGDGLVSGELGGGARGDAGGAGVVDEGDLARREVVADEEDAIDDEAEAVGAVAGELEGAQGEPGELGVRGFAEAAQRGGPAVAGRPRDVPSGVEVARVVEVLGGARVAALDRLGEDAADVDLRAGERGVAHDVVPVTVGEHHRRGAAELVDPRGDRGELAREVRRVDDDAGAGVRDDRRVGLPDAAGQDVDVHPASIRRQIGAIEKLTRSLPLPLVRMTVTSLRQPDSNRLTEVSLPRSSSETVSWSNR